MNANEFRIGNFVYDTFNASYDIIQIDLDDFCVMRNYQMSNHENPYQPIPITKDWLVKFGFVKDENVYLNNNIYVQYVLNMIAIRINDNAVLIKNTDWVCITTFENPIKYVHQIQNLYFLLSGNELKLV